MESSTSSAGLTNPTLADDHLKLQSSNLLTSGRRFARYPPTVPGNDNWYMEWSCSPSENLSLWYLYCFSAISSLSKFNLLSYRTQTTGWILFCLLPLSISQCSHNSQEKPRWNRADTLTTIHIDFLCHKGDKRFMRFVFSCWIPHCCSAPSHMHELFFCNDWAAILE